MPEPTGPGDASTAAFAGIAITASQPRRPAQREPKASRPRWRELAANRRVQVAAGGGILAIVGLVFLAVWLFAGGEKRAVRDVAKKQPGAAGKTATSGRSPISADGAGIVEFKVDDEVRRNMAIDIDGTPIFIKTRGPLEAQLAPGTHEIVIRRRGFEMLNVQMVVREGDRTVYEPKWEPLVLPTVAGAGGSAGGQPAPGEPAAGDGVPPSFDTWLQDFDAAKREAAETNKDILVLFDGSDWCPYSVRMANELFFDPRFQSQVAWKYVLVFVDFPRGDEAKAKVQDADRNQRLMESFGVGGFPAIVMADKAGLPYGRLGYEPGGVDQFLNQATAVQEIRDQRDALVEEVRLSLGAEKVAAARRTLQLLAALEFVTPYADLFQSWYDESQQSDAANAQGHQEAFFEIVWMTTIEGVREGDRQRLAQVIAQLDTWKQNQKFKDANRAGRMHVQAALAVQHDVKAVERYAEEGLPTNPPIPRSENCWRISRRRRRR